MRLHLVLLVLLSLVFGCVGVSAVGPLPPPTDADGFPLPPGAVARLGSLRFWHGAGPVVLAVAHDGNTLATAGPTQTPQHREEIKLVLWDPATGLPRREFQCEQAILQLAFSPDDRRLLLRTQDGLEILDLATQGKRRLAAALPRYVSFLAFLPGGRSVAVGTVNEVRFIDLTTGKVTHTRTTKTPPAFRSAYWIPLLHPNREALVWQKFTGSFQEPPDWRVAAAGGYVEALTTGKQLHSYATGLFLGGDSAQQVLLRVGEHVEVWHLTQHKSVAKMEIPTPWYTNATSEMGAYQIAGDTFLATQPEELLLGNARSWQLQRTIRLPNRHWFSTGRNAVLFLDGKTLAQVPHGRVILFDVATGRQKPISPDHRGHVVRLWHSPEGWLVSSCGMVERQWGTQTRRPDVQREISTELLPSGERLADVPFGFRSLVSSTPDGHLKFREFDSGKLIRDCTTLRIGNWDLFALGPTGAHAIATAKGADCQCIDLTTGKSSVLAHTADSIRRSWSPNGRLVVVEGEGPVLRVFDTPAARKRFVLLPTLFPLPDGTIPSEAKEKTNSLDTTVLFCARSSLLVSARLRRGGSQGQLILDVDAWDLQTGKRRTAWSTDFVGHADLGRIALSADGRLLATLAFGKQNLIEFREVLSGQVCGTLPIPRLPFPLCMAFAPDGQTIAVGQGDGTVVLWRLPELWPGIHPRQAHLTARQVEALWADLAHEDPRRARSAMGALLFAPGDAITLFRRQLAPKPTVTAERVSALLKQLDADRFAERQEAERELRSLGDGLRRHLGDDVRATLPLECRMRVRRVLAALEHPTSHSNRELRALEVLERLGTRDAHDLLKRLAEGEPADTVTLEANHALARMRKSAWGIRP